VIRDSSPAIPSREGVTQRRTYPANDDGEDTHRVLIALFGRRRGHLCDAEVMAQLRQRHDALHTRGAIRVHKDVMQRQLSNQPRLPSAQNVTCTGP